MTIAFEEALEILEKVDLPLRMERVSLSEALHRVLAEEIRSDVDVPPFHKSAMDGYACRKEDLKMELVVREEIPAGKVPEQIIGPGECARIFTGAMVPEGADTVIMQEHVEIHAPGRIRCTQVGQATNICYRGEDVKAGERVLSPGLRIRPAHIALLASAGCMQPKVYCLPRVAILSTGNELVEPDMQPETGKIRNSNGYQLAAQVSEQGARVSYFGIVGDDPVCVKARIREALEKHDLVVISGGVSVGDYDFVPAVLGELKAEILFQGLRVKPGRHMVMARIGDRLIGGLPGNPVSSFVQGELLIKPLLNRMTGLSELATMIRMTLEIDYMRKKTDTLQFVPVRFTASGTVIPVEYHGSAHIHAYSTAQGIMKVPPGTHAIKKGDSVYVRYL